MLTSPLHSPGVKRGGLLLAGATAIVLVLATLVAPAAVRAETAAACTQPTFVDGLSQSVFTATPSQWVRGEAWVEAPFDSDNDGKLDRIHIDTTLPPETADPACNLEVPVIFEDSPYYAGLGPSENWAVDHELGFPPASHTEEPYFTARNTSPIISTIYESTWLPRGFAVVHAESPGTGLSDGCPTSGAPNETLAAKAVIDWLNGRATAYTTRTGTTAVLADWTTGKVGMIGTSYNGTIAEGVATTGVEGLEAIVPISAISNWYDYYRANGAVRAPYTFQGEDLDVLEDAVYSRADEPAPKRLICQPVIADTTAHIDRATGDYNAFWNERNYMKDVQNVHAAALVAHGNMDLNVMTKNFDQFYGALRAQNVPHMLYFHRGGHGGAPPDVLINRWFTRYLYGVQNGVESLPRAWIVREANACPPRQTTAVGDQSNTASLTVADSSRLTLGFTATIPQLNTDGTTTATTRTITSIPDSTHIVLAFPVATAFGQKVADGAVISHVCGTGAPTPYAEWPDPSSSVAEVNFTAGAPGVGGLTFQSGSSVDETLTDAPTTSLLTLANADSDAARLVYKSPVLTNDVRISGTVKVNLWMSFSKPRANLTAVLADFPATGTVRSNSTFQERSTRGWLDPENRGGDPAVSEPITPGTFYRMHFDLQPKDLVAVAGRRLVIMIVSSDQESSIRPAPGTQLTLDLNQSWAEIPVVGGAQALAEAFGDTAPTVAYTLDPADPTGQNGWYKGNVSLSWQIGDGGAAVAKTGCVDETFGTDGTFTRSCTATNAVGSTGPVTVTVRRDATAPITTATLTPTPIGAWYSPRTVSLSGADGVIGSGVSSTEYRLDGGLWTPYAGPFFVATFGPHTLEFHSTDAAGNVEAIKTESWGTEFTIAEQLAGLSDFVGRLDLDKRLTHDLQDILKNAAKKLDKQKDACRALAQFAKKVAENADGKKSKLTAAQAEQLNAGVAQIRSELGC
jgi:predicted acyl esterase